MVLNDIYSRSADLSPAAQVMGAMGSACKRMLMLCKAVEASASSASATVTAVFPLDAQVMGAVGSARKRTLMLWQAVELSRAGDAPDAATLDIARRALEPPPDPRAAPPAEALTKRRTPLASGVPRHWSFVRCGCIEGVVVFLILRK